MPGIAGKSDNRGILERLSSSARAEGTDLLSKLGAVDKRVSPSGTNEYTIPPALLPLYFGLIGPQASAYASPEGIYYRPRAAKDLDTTRHERIHAAQFGLPEATQEQVEGAMANVGRTHDPLERPAFGFSGIELEADPDLLPPELAKGMKTQQQAYNDYIDLMYRLSGGRTSQLETAAYSPLEMDYIRNHPRPYLPPDPNMKQVNIFTGK